MYAFQPGAFQGIVNGQSDQWFVDNTTASVEEVTDDQDDWWTEDVGATNRVIDTPFGPVSNDVATSGVRNASPSAPQGVFDRGVPRGVSIFALTDEPQQQTVSKVKSNRVFAFPSWKVEDMRES